MHRAIYLLRHEPDEARRRLDKRIALAKEFGLSPTIVAAGRFQLGWALATRGTRRKVLERCARRLRPLQRLGWHWKAISSVSSRSCGESGEASEGMNLLERALEIARSGAKYQLPEFLRTKGDLLLRLNPHDGAAENWFRRALMAARDEGTKSLELRAALSLARLYRAHQRERKARDVLAPSTPGSPRASLHAISSRQRTCSINYIRKSAQ